MNAENFVDYLVQPAKLYQLPYQEIKNLVEEYPFSANLRRLLLLKSKIEDDPSFEVYLHQFAAHTFDREHLYELITKKLDELLELDDHRLEERLELKSLDALDLDEKVVLTVDSLSEEAPPPLAQQEQALLPDFEEIQEEETEEEPAEPSLALDNSAPPSAATPSLVALEASSPAPSDIPGPAADLPAVDEPMIEEPTVDLPAANSPTTTSVTPASLPGFLPSNEFVHNLVGFSLLTKEELTPRASDTFATIAPAADSRAGQRFRRRKFSQTAPNSTNSTIDGVLTTESEVNIESEKQAKAKKPKKKSKAVKQIAKRSIKDQPNLASETLAKLLVRQEQYEQAIKIYQRLSLRSPEKSRYFAATIEKLKLKL